MRNYRRFIWIGLLPLLLLLISAARGQTMQVTGKIIDSVTLQPVPDASVFLVNTTLGTKTDAAGNYSFARIPAGPSGFIVSCTFFTLQEPIFCMDVDWKNKAIYGLTHNNNNQYRITYKFDVQ